MSVQQNGSVKKNSTEFEVKTVLIASNETYDAIFTERDNI